MLWRKRKPRKRANGLNTAQKLALKLRLGSEQNWRCCYCGRRMEELRSATFDHVIAKSRGGTDEYENMVLACRPCNQTKARDSYLGHYNE